VDEFKSFTQRKGKHSKFHITFALFLSACPLRIEIYLGNYKSFGKTPWNGIGPSQYLYLHKTAKQKNAVKYLCQSGIRNTNPNVKAIQDAAAGTGCFILYYLVLVVHYRSVWYMYVLLSELDKMFVTRTAFVSVTSSY